ncbi:MAG: LppX_LprAFG lipoprotein [Verrucomicrobiaceae bacterium]|nr:MAG: LppX_LprAFG lipoprotein [Verrucomicrobiaceae bacterium]
MPRACFFSASGQVRRSINPTDGPGSPSRLSRALPFPCSSPYLRELCFYFHSGPVRIVVSLLTHPVGPARFIEWTSKRLIVIVVCLGGLLAFTGCSSETKPDDTTPGEVLAAAKTKLDEASSWRLSLSTKSVPKGGNGVLSAEGVGTHAPAWEGDVKAILNGIPVTVPIVAIDGKVHAKLPLTPTWSEINPSEYSAPDPADFMDPDKGVSSLLADVEGAAKGSETRDGDQIITTYSGNLPGAKVKTIIPSASESATYSTEVGINDKGEVATVSVTGPFFSGNDDVTYDIKIGSYDEDVKISAP